MITIDEAMIRVEVREIKIGRVNGAKKGFVDLLSLNSAREENSFQGMSYYPLGAYTGTENEGERW